MGGAAHAKTGWLIHQLVARYTFCALITALAVVTGCTAESEAQNIDVLIGAKDGAGSILSVDLNTMTFVSNQAVDIDNINYVRTVKDRGVFVLSSGELSVYKSKSLQNTVVEKTAQTKTENDPTAVEARRDGKIIFTAHFSNNILSARVFDGLTFSPPQDFECGWAHQFRPHPNGKWAYGACMKNTLRQFNIEQNTLSVSPMDAGPIEIKGGPRHLEFHPSGGVIYVLLQISSQVAVYKIDPTTGQLVTPPVQIIFTTPDGSKNKSSDLHITPDGRWLYAFNRADQNMAVFQVTSDGKLQFQSVVPMPYGEVRDWIMSPSGDFLITASDKGHVGLWEINSASGDLKLRDTSEGHRNAITASILDY